MVGNAMQPFDAWRAADAAGSGNAPGFMDRALSGAHKFMSEQKLYPTAAMMGGQVMSSYSRQKAAEEEVARRRQAIIDGYRSGFGLGPWRA